MSGTAVGKVDTAKRGWVKKLGATFVVLAIFWVAGCALIYREMRKPPEQFGNFMKRIPAPVAFLAFPFESMWMKARAGTVNVGDRAPDFTLQALDGNASVELAALNRERPVVLIFGSYT